jgi:hypothetical protein
MEPAGILGCTYRNTFIYRLILISIAVTYLIPVVSAEIMKRKISVHITLGGSVEKSF